MPLWACICTFCFFREPFKFMKNLLPIALVLLPFLLGYQQKPNPQLNFNPPKKRTIIPDKLYFDPESSLLSEFPGLELQETKTDPVFKMPIAVPNTKHATPIFPADTTGVMPIRVFKPV